jgi:hypothetical protein
MNMRHYQIAARYRVQVERDAALEQAAIAAPEPDPAEEYRAATDGLEAEMMRVDKFSGAVAVGALIFAAVVIASGWLL